MKYNIVLLPNDDVAKKSIVVSGALSASESLFVLDGIGFHPHLSLYMVWLEESDLPEAIKRLGAISAQTSGVPLVASHYYHEYGFIGVEYGRSAEVSDLQKTVLDSVSPIRDRVSEGGEDISTLTGVASENFRKYGYVTIGELFRPHITFTRLKSERTEDEIAPLMNTLPKDSASFDGLFSKIGLFELGENGTCIRKVAEFNIDSEKTGK